MQRFYSASTGCTYLEGINLSMPNDAVPISDAIYLAVIARPTPGKLRGRDASGLPILIDLPPAAVDELVGRERKWRDDELVAVTWLRDRHRDQHEIGGTTALTGEQFAELLAYMQDLRDWPQSERFPAIEHRPEPPAWLSELAP